MSIIIPMISSAISIIITYSMILYYAIKIQKKLLPLKLYISILFCYMVWSLFNLTNQLNYLVWPNDYNLFMEFVSICTYIPSYFISPIWLIMCIIYSELTDKYRLNKKLIYTIIILPIAINLIIYLTNKYHGFVGYWSFEKQSYVLGPAYLFQITLSAVYTLLGISLMVYHEINNNSRYGKIFVLMLFVFLPLSIDFFYYFKGYLDQSIFMNITPTAQLIFIILSNFAFFKFQFFDIETIAVNDVFQNMDEFIIVINNKNKIISFNNSYKSIFNSFPSITTGDDINSLTKILQSNIKSNLSSNQLISLIDKCNKETSPELIFNDEVFLVNEKKFLSINVRPVMAKNNIHARIITFRDITTHKKTNEEISIKNQKLEVANEELKQYALTVKELAVSRERNRFAKELHDSVGHSLSLLIAIVSSCTVSHEAKKENLKENLEQILSIAQEGLSDLRRSVYGLSSENLSTFDLLNSLKYLAKKYEQSGVKVALTVEGDVDSSTTLNDEIYSICKECLSNALKHGSPNHVEIIVAFLKNIVRIFIIDDGVGCKEINKGIGLKGIENSVASLQGNLSFGSDGERGFSIHVEIPVPK